MTAQGSRWGTGTTGVKNSANMEAAPQLCLGSHKYSLCNNFEIEQGRDLSRIDVDDYNNVCVLGSQAAIAFFDLADPVGKTLNVNGIPFTVIGVYAQKDNYNDARWSMDNMILFPYTASRTLGQEMSFMSDFVVKAKNGEAATEITTRLIGFLSEIGRAHV